MRGDNINANDSYCYLFWCEHIHNFHVCACRVTSRLVAYF